VTRQLLSYYFDRGGSSTKVEQLEWRRSEIIGTSPELYLMISLLIRLLANATNKEMPESSCSICFSYKLIPILDLHYFISAHL